MIILKRFQIVSLTKLLSRSNREISNVFFILSSFSIKLSNSAFFLQLIESNISIYLISINSYEKIEYSVFAFVFKIFKIKSFSKLKKININIISTTIYYYFIIKHVKNKNYEFFVMSFNNINKILNYIKFRINIRFMSKINEAFI